MNGDIYAGQIVTIARQWLATPYVHQASIKYQGCDCLGLVRGIWREIYGSEPAPTPAYSPDWGEVGGREILLQAVEKYFIKALDDHLKPGRLILFRWNDAAIIKHLGIMTDHNHFIHAYEKTGVVESPLVGSWLKNIVAVYSFPGVKY